MRLRPVSARERRMLAVLILVAVLAAIHFGIAAPILDGFAQRAARREQLALQYAHNLRLIAAIPRLRREAEQQRAAAADFAVPARNAEEGREWLKTRLGRAIASAGGSYRSGEDAQRRQGWAGARASAMLTPPQLAALLVALQNQPPWLVVERLTISPQESIADERSRTMDVEIEASIPIRPATAG